MKYSIFVQTFTSSLVRKQYLPKTKKKRFLAQKLEKKKNLSKSVSGYYKTKKEKKMAWTTKPLVYGG